jgi:hypothetical protein
MINDQTGEHLRITIDVISNLPAPGKTDIGKIKIERVTKELIYEDVVDEYHD